MLDIASKHCMLWTINNILEGSIHLGWIQKVTVFHGLDGVESISHLKIFFYIDYNAFIDMKIIESMNNLYNSQKSG